MSSLILHRRALDTFYHIKSNPWHPKKNRQLFRPNYFDKPFLLKRIHMHKYSLFHICICVIGPLCGEFTGHRWIPFSNVSDAELWFFFGLRSNKSLSKQSWVWWFETPSRSLWRHCNCILNRLFRHRSKKTSSFASLAFVWGIHQWPVNSPHRWPVTRKMFPFDDVIILLCFDDVIMPMSHCRPLSLKFRGLKCIRCRTSIMICSLFSLQLIRQR